MRTIALSLALAWLVLPGTAAAATPAQHDHHAPAAAIEAPAQRHATDAPLRENMRGIRAAVEQLEHPPVGAAGIEQTQRLAGQVEQHVRDIIANCKLAPAADAALHAIIVPLMQQAGKLKAEPADGAALAAMRAALEQYPLQFDDPDWSAAQH